MVVTMCCGINATFIKQKVEKIFLKIFSTFCFSFLILFL